MKRYDEFTSVEELMEAYNIKPLSKFLILVPFQLY